MILANHQTINPRGLKKLTEKTLSLWAPPPRFSISEWADANAYIPREGNAEPGKFRCDRLPYQAAMLNDPLDPAVSETAWMIASQICKTASIVIICEYFIHQQPSPMLVVYPTVDSAESFSKEKLTPSINETPCLRGLVKDSRSRDANNTTLNKRFPGGNITMCGANSPSGLRQRSKRVIIQDEIDAFEDNKEGDPLELADKRAETFHNAVKLKSSTPTIKGLSRIEKLYEESDKQQWFCPCKKCGQFQTLKWSQVKWLSDDDTAAAWYECEKCLCAWSDADRITAIHAGEWRATAPFKGIRGRHLSGLYRLMGKKKAFKSYLHEFVAGFLKAKRKGKKSLMVWVNTFLAETFQDDTEKVEPHSLMGRREGYTAAPSSVLVITVGADVQADRVEIEVIGWGVNEESWGLQYVVVPGRYDDPKTWEEVERVLSQKFDREDGLQLGISAAIIDSGAFQDHVLKFTKTRFVRHIIGGKGVNAAGHPVLSTISRSNKLRAPQYRLGTDTAKGIIIGRLKQIEPGAGYMHFPLEASAGFGHQYFEQLTAEEFKTVWRKGALHREWVKDSGKRNEALDCRVYGLAALYHLNPNWTRLQKNLAKRAAPPPSLPQSDTECPTSEPTAVATEARAATAEPATGAGEDAAAKKKLLVRRRPIGGLMRFQAY